MKSLSDHVRWNNSCYQSSLRNQTSRKELTEVSSLHELCRPVITTREIPDEDRTLDTDRLIHVMSNSECEWMTSHEIVRKAKLSDTNAFFSLIDGIRRRHSDKYRIERQGKRGQLEFKIVEVK